jgi:hypothetical protein
VREQVREQELGQVQELGREQVLERSPAMSLLFLLCRTAQLIQFELLVVRCDCCCAQAQSLRWSDVAPGVIPGDFFDQ